MNDRKRVAGKEIDMEVILLEKVDGQLKDVKPLGS